MAHFEVNESGGAVAKVDTRRQHHGGQGAAVIPVGVVTVEHIDVRRDLGNGVGQQVDSGPVRHRAAEVPSEALETAQTPTGQTLATIFGGELSPVRRSARRDREPRRRPIGGTAESRRSRIEASVSLNRPGCDHEKDRGETCHPPGVRGTRMPVRAARFGTGASARSADSGRREVRKQLHVCSWADAASGVGGG